VVCAAHITSSTSEALTIVRAQFDTGPSTIYRTINTQRDATIEPDRCQARRLYFLNLRDKSLRSARRTHGTPPTLSDVMEVVQDYVATSHLRKPCGTTIRAYLDSSA
jgi:hypothetical protein